MCSCCQIIHTDFKPENVMLVEPLRDRTWLVPDPAALQQVGPTGVGRPW
jgi:serine/threonine-protein kinase SRPK3